VGFGLWVLGFGILGLGSFGFWILSFGIWNLGFGFGDFEFWDLEFEVLLGFGFLNLKIILFIAPSFKRWANSICILF
jgi:hypothetical protein